MTEKVVRRILQQYGLSPDYIHTAQKGYRNESYAATLKNGRQVNLVIYKYERAMLRRINNANRVANYAATHGLPVRQTIDHRIICLHVGARTRYGALYNYLPGKTIPWEAYTMGHIKQLGKALSDTHAVLRDLTKDTLPLVTDEYHAICCRMEQYFNNPGVQSAMAEKLALRPPQNLTNYKALVRKLEMLPSQQALHMDFVRGNVLFEIHSNEITGIIDFEKAAWGHPAFDIARTLAFLLVDCKYKTPDKVHKYFLYSGYSKRGKAKLPHIATIKPLIELFLLYDFYKFLLHNPYEFLEQNEHFIRTRNCLLKRNTLTQIAMLE